MMEERRLAHCDLSAPNLLLPGLLTPPDEPPVALVDVEQLFGSGLDRPAALPGGSSGYAHRTAPAGLWSAQADRFAGAVLLAEILGWSDPQVRAAAAEESYFEPVEVQRPGPRLDLLCHALTAQWGPGVSQLFEQAWESPTLSDCPTFGEWLVALPAAPLVAATSADGPPAAAAGAAGLPETVRVLLELATTLRGQGNREGALAAYRQTLGLLPPGVDTAAEIRLLIADLEQPSVFPPDRAPVTLSPDTEDVATTTPELDQPFGVVLSLVLLGALLACGGAMVLQMLLLL